MVLLALVFSIFCHNVFLLVYLMPNRYCLYLLWLFAVYIVSRSTRSSILWFFFFFYVLHGLGSLDQVSLFLIVNKSVFFCLAAMILKLKKERIWHESTRVPPHYKSYARALDIFVLLLLNFWHTIQKLSAWIKQSEMRL